MGFLIGVLTFILVMDCLFLMLLILIQLPKKEAGMGTAFGGAATDALFGAGKGNTLTQLTKYTAVVFFALALLLGTINAHRSLAQKSSFSDALRKQSAPSANMMVPPPAPANPASAAAPNASTNLLSINATNLAPTPKAPATNNAEAPTK
jgi:preprotein translocase subunit SecG